MSVLNINAQYQDFPQSKKNGDIGCTPIMPIENGNFITFSEKASIDYSIKSEIDFGCNYDVKIFTLSNFKEKYLSILNISKAYNYNSTKLIANKVTDSSNNINDNKEYFIDGSRINNKRAIIHIINFNKIQ